MEIYSIIVIDATTGVPIYTYRNESKIKYDDDKNVLFSGAMMAIQHLMKEFDGGKLQTIKTEEYDLCGESGDRFAMFTVGKIDNPQIVFHFMKMVIVFLESENLPEIIVMLEENHVLLLETMITQFIDLWHDRNITSNTLVFSKRLGFQVVNEITDIKLNNFLIGYLSSLPKSFMEKDHSFILKYNKNHHLFGVLYNLNGKSMVQVISILNSSVSIISSNTHIYVRKSIEFLENNEALIDMINDGEEYLNQFNKNNMEFCNKLIQTLSNYSIDMDFLGMENILFAFDKYIPRILGSLLSGIPLTVVASDVDYAKPIIDMLVYTTGITEVDLSEGEFIHARLSWCTNKQKYITEKAGYMILDLNLTKVFGRKENNFFKNIWKSILKTQKDYTLILYELRTHCTELWNECEYLLEKGISGDLDKLIDERGVFKERKDMLRDMIYWLNPHLSKNGIIKQHVIKNKILW